MCDILWSDPDEDEEAWGPNDRGVSVVFGPREVTKFLKKFDLDLICRAHQVIFLIEFLKMLGCGRWL